MHSTQLEAKDLTAEELAQRKDDENQLKLEFEVFVFGIYEIYKMQDLSLSAERWGGGGSCFPCCLSQPGFKILITIIYLLLASNMKSAQIFLANAFSIVVRYVINPRA